jgi:protein kinase C substrate 80K-H
VDEPNGACPDVCEEVLKEERENRRKIEENFRVGYNKRKHDLYNFRKQREEKLKELGQLEQEAASLQTDDIQSSMDDLKRSYFTDRIALAKSVAEDMHDLIDTLDSNELRAFITYSCQLAGELSDRDTSTCVALRLAGLDMKMTWSEDMYAPPMTFEYKVNSSLESGFTMDMADLVFDNALDGNLLQWTLPDKRRRLEEFNDDYHGEEDYHGDDDYHYHDYDDDNNSDNIEIEEEAYESPYRPPPKKRNINARTLAGKEKEKMDAIKAMPFSKTRVAFLSQAEELISKINAYEEELMKSEEDDQGDGESKEITKDPAAYSLSKKALSVNEDRITKGFEWGSSAMLFSEISTDLSQGELAGLAIGTVMHGRLGAAHVWQILQAILPEYQKLEDTSLPETCASPWKAFCPPKPISRIKGISYPPSFILNAADLFCTQLATESMKEGFCSVDEDSNDGIPVTIPDGYYGYYSPEPPRALEDPLTPFFAPLLSFQADKSGVNSLAKSISGINSEKKTIEKQIDDTWREIGGKDGDELGPNGELHAIANECFEVEQGKYTYEVCIFEGAAQKEGKAKHGTNLGKWTGMQVEDGERVMRWENGAKCWNGPSRSATVHLSCGPEGKILSADEPDTCRYVFTMESHIACDEDYKAKMGF